MILPGVNGFMNAETFNDPYLMNHQINMMGCDGDDECKYFGKEIFQGTKDTTIILGSTFYGRHLYNKHKQLDMVYNPKLLNC